MSEPMDDGLFVPDPGFLDDENTFRLDFAQDESRSASLGIPIDAGHPHVSKPVAEDVTSQSLQQSLSPVIEPPPGSTRQMTEIETAVPSRPPRRKKLKLTQKGNAVPALPSSLVKKVAIDSMTRIGKKRPVISREHLAALEQATEWFFEQVGEDLEAYSNHAKRRKRIDDTDVMTLMKRQRVIGRGQSLDELAQEFLPDEILLNLTLPDED
jgi:histone H3/H4